MAIKNTEILHAKQGNVIVIDPNKVIVNDVTLGQSYVQDRTVAQEDLIMYAGLKAYSKGRTSIYDDGGNGTHVVDFGQIAINFLNPKKTEDTFKNVFTTQWTDVFADPRGADTVLDPETFGITSIEITQNASLIPRIVIEFTDVRGKTLMERGNNVHNPYNLFYSIPYPTFLLTVKGYYGKGITYPLVLLKTNTKLDPSTGNYNIRCEFLSRTFSIFNDFLLIYGLALPYMYPKNTANGLIYEGREILNKLYSIQNDEIIAQYKEKGISKDDPEVKSRLIEHPVTLYDLVRNVDHLYKNDLTAFTDTNAATAFEARSTLDVVTDVFSAADGIIVDHFQSTELFKTGNGYYTYLNADLEQNDVELTQKIQEINDSYKTNILDSANPRVKMVDSYVKSKLGNQVSASGLISINTFKTNIAGVGPAYTTQVFENIMSVVEDGIRETYGKVTDEVVQAQREILREKILFDPTLENVVRVFMNSMQAFLMLLNLKTKEAFQQIQNNDARRYSQKKSGEYYVDNSTDAFFPWPNYYVQDKNGLKDGSETHRRIFPGYKTINANWSEVQFVEEIYKSLGRINDADNPDQKKPTTITALISPFLNVAALDQYVRIDKVDTTFEIMKKISLSLIHDNILFKVFKTPQDLDAVTQALSKYDMLSLDASLTNMPKDRALFELKFIYDQVFKNSSDLFTTYTSTVGSNIVDLAILNLQMEAENDAFVQARKTGDASNYNTATAAFYENGDVAKQNVNYIQNKDQYLVQLYLRLIAESDPLMYTNPKATATGTRTSQFDDMTASNNKKYSAQSFTGFGVTPNPYTNVEYQNLMHGIYNIAGTKKVDFDYDLFFNGSVNQDVSGIPALTFNNIGIPGTSDKTIIQKYSKY